MTSLMTDGSEHKKPVLPQLPKLDPSQFTSLSEVKPVDNDHLSKLSSLISNGDAAAILTLADDKYWADKQTSFISILLLYASDDLLKQVLKRGPPTYFGFPTYTTLASQYLGYFALSWFLRMNSIPTGGLIVNMKNDGSLTMPEPQDRRFTAPGMWAMKRLEFLMEAGLLTEDQISFALGRGCFSDQGCESPHDRIEKLALLATDEKGNIRSGSGTKVISKKQLSGLVAHILGYDQHLTPDIVHKYVVEKRWTTIAAISNKPTGRTYRGAGAQYWVTVYMALLKVCAAMTDEQYLEIDPTDTRPKVDGPFAPDTGARKDDVKSARRREMETIKYFLDEKLEALMREEKYADEKEVAKAKAKA